MSGSADNTIKVWTQRGAELTTLRGHRQRITSVVLAMSRRPAKTWGDMADDPSNASEETEAMDITKVKVLSSSDDCTVRWWMPLLVSFFFSLRVRWTALVSGLETRTTYQCRAEMDTDRNNRWIILSLSHSVSL